MLEGLAAAGYQVETVPIARFEIVALVVVGARVAAVAGHLVPRDRVAPARCSSGVSSRWARCSETRRVRARRCRSTSTSAAGVCTSSGCTRARSSTSPGRSPTCATCAVAAARTRAGDRRRRLQPLGPRRGEPAPRLARTVGGDLSGAPAAQPDRPRAREPRGRVHRVGGDRAVRLRSPGRAGVSSRPARAIVG